uniref:Uncharacterized protein n=1 Tax=Loxodonta africana TaxID=9785 RepID=G3U2I5_LOXAF
PSADHTQPALRAAYTPGQTFLLKWTYLLGNQCPCITQREIEKKKKKEKEN